MPGGGKKLGKSKKKGCCQRLCQKLNCKKQNYIVYWDFQAMNEDEISIQRGETVEWIKDVYSTDQFGEKQLRWKWSQVRKLTRVNNEKGYIPRSFLVPLKDYEKFSLYKNTDWYVGRKYPLEARNPDLSSPSAEKGTFVVCAPPTYRSKKNLPEYSLLVRVSERGKEMKTKTYRIRRDNYGRYYIKWGIFAPNLIFLIRLLCTYAKQAFS